MIKQTKLVVSLVACIAILSSFSCSTTSADASTISIDDLLAPSTVENKQTTALQKDIANRVRRALLEAHFAPQVIDDSFSVKVFDKFIEQCDFGKSYFTNADITEFATYKTKLDNQFLDDDISFYELVYNRLKTRIAESMDYYNAAIAKPQNFTTNKTIQLDGKKLNWSNNTDELKNRWADVITYRVLGKYIELEENQNTKKDTVKGWKILSKEALIDSAKKSVKKNMDMNFKRIQKNGSDEYFAGYMNAICAIFDPHTDYYAPAKKKEFDVQMSGTFFGIGAVLKDVDGYCTIQEIKAGTPCYLQGSLKVDDKILKIGQGAEEPVEVVGWDITNEVIPLIRGKKGTEVRLTVKHTNGKEEVIPIVRGEIHMDEVFAKSSIIKEGNKKIGYIHLPEFYADFQNEDGKRCAVDMRKEVEKLKAEGVDGMMIDLRYNGGGSLSDVVDIAGLFVGDGPIVQVKSKDAKGKALPAIGAKVLYDGPLAIMINNYSASASEILAAAMQDYKRAIIVGTNTYGKGTVQQQIDLSRVAPSTNGEMGSIKLTLQKFYRVNGGSTQRKGVVPDVVLPEYLMYTDKGERNETSALPYDEIESPDYRKTNSLDVNTIAAQSKKRIVADNYFKIVEQRAVQVKQQQDDNVYSLNEKGYKEQIKKIKDFNAKLEDLDKQKVNLEMYNPKMDMAKILENDVTKKRNEDWLKLRKKDANIKETVNILSSIINTKK